jgi:hypothetical protein
MITTIYCAYPDGHLPADWFQAVRRARRAADRQGLTVRIEPTAESRVPPDAEFVVTPETHPAATLAAAVEDLIQKLVADGSVTRDASPPRTVVHRGYEPLGGRARLAD